MYTAGYECIAYKKSELEFVRTYQYYEINAALLLLVYRADLFDQNKAVSLPMLVLLSRGVNDRQQIPVLFYEYYSTNPIFLPIQTLHFWGMQVNIG